MLWMMRILLALSLGLMGRSGDPQVSAPEFQLSTAAEAAVGEAQTWYLTITFPADDKISDLLIENGSPETWNLQQVHVAAPNPSELVQIKTIAIRAGTLRPRLLLTYRNGQETIHQVVESEPVSILNVVDQLDFQVVSSNAEAKLNQRGKLTAMVRNNSPFPAQVRIMALDGSNLIQPIPLATGEKRLVSFDLDVPTSGLLTVEASFAWTDSRQEDHTTALQASAGPFTQQQSPLAQSLPTLIGVIAGGLISFLATFARILFKQSKENNARIKKEQAQAAGFMQMVQLDCRQAYNNRQMIDMKYLDKLLQKSQLYKILVDRKMGEVTWNLWVAAQSYNRRYDSQHATEEYGQLKIALDAYEKAWETQKKEKEAKMS